MAYTEYYAPTHVYFGKETEPMDASSRDPAEGISLP